MSIDDALPEEWDALRRDEYHDNRTIPKPECTLVKSDNVNLPQHCRVGGEIECIDYIYQQLGSGVKDYILGNVHKYLHRHRFKGQALEDLKKAQWYLNKLIMEEEQGG